MKKIFLTLMFFLSAGCAHSQAGRNSHSSSCSNTEIYQNFAFASCDHKIVIQNLIDKSEIQTQLKADDLAIADGFLFTIEMNDTLSMYSLSQATHPLLIQSIDDIPAKFFTGISAAEGFLVISGGLKEPSFLKYDDQGMQKLSWNTKANNYFGRPDVSLFKIGSSLKAVFSLDVSLTYKWGAHIFTFMKDKIANDQFIPLESGLSPFQLVGYAPTNFPISSAVIGNEIYISHWKTKEIIQILGENNSSQSVLKTDYTISHMKSDARYLYFVSKQTSGQFYRLDPRTKELTVIKDSRIQEPTNITVSNTHWAIADKIAGLITGKL